MPFVTRDKESSQCPFIQVNEQGLPMIEPAWSGYQEESIIEYVTENAPR